MTSRLDRLFILLESGSSAVTRRAAAKQIGEVQKLHPHELHNLLQRVHTYLTSASWDTRIAASQAVEAILTNVPQWNPKPVKIKEEEKPHLSDAGTLSFQNFNLSTVLERGARLMGSEGTEFDCQDDDVEDMEHLKLQRARLNEKLGIGNVSSPMNVSQLVCLDDMRQHVKDDYDPNKRLMPVVDLLTFSNNGHQSSHGLSCREMNRARRKARQNPGVLNSANNGNGASGSTPSLSRSSSNGSIEMYEVDRKRSKIDGKFDFNITGNDLPVPDGTGQWSDAKEWPLDYFCSKLYLDLFNPRWETRHGAATALRELIKTHSAGAGKCLGMSEMEMSHAHQLWIEDAALRLLCVLSLDRFGDFISDQVVAPVRETCAQVLGTVLREMPLETVQSTVRILLELIKQSDWEVRHGGLLGIKYMLVVREDLLDTLLPLTMNDILTGLFDSVDDVGSVAASTLVPISVWLPKLLTITQLSDIVKMLWDLLLDQDDLTAASNSFMALLAAILSVDGLSNWIKMEPMNILIPRLWPFLCHTSTSVRRSTLQTLRTLTQVQPINSDKIQNGMAATHQLIELSTIKHSTIIENVNFGVKDWPPHLLQEALRHIYQRILVEHVEDIQLVVEQVWINLIENSELSALLHAACPYVATWMCLAMQPARLSFDPALLIVPKYRTMRSTDAVIRSPQKMFLGGMETIPIDVREKNIPRARCKAAKMLGLLSKYLVLPAPGATYTTDIESPIQCYTKILLGYLSSKSSLQRLISGMIVSFWAEYDISIKPGPEQLCDRLKNILNEFCIYDEVTIYLTRLLQESRDFIATLKLYKIPINDFDNCPVLTLDQIQQLSTTMTDNLKVRFGLRQKIADLLQERRRGLQQLYGQTTIEQNSHNVCTQAVVAGAAVRLECLPERLNPIIKPLMESIKREECEIFQQLSARYLVGLLNQTANRDPCPNNKIVTNLCTLLKSDSDFTPTIPLDTVQFADYPYINVPDDTNPIYGILTLSNQQKPGRDVQNGTVVHRGPGRPAFNAFEITGTGTEDGVVDDMDPSRKQHRIQRCGATFAIRAICEYFGESITNKIPILWQFMTEKIKSMVDGIPAGQWLVMPLNVEESNKLIMCLQLIEVAAEHLDKKLHNNLFLILPCLAQLLKHPLKAVRHMSARCFATLATVHTLKVMDLCIECIVPNLQSIDAVIHRQGSVEAIACIVNRLQFKIVPYVVLLVIPLLGKMSDPDQSVRLMSTHCFATLIQLMPLDGQGTDELSVMSVELQSRKRKDKEFLECLFSPKTIPDFAIPDCVNAELRSYQQAGVNWLWFLNKYKLHGILCDDMGLGKTLQTICILAGDQYERQRNGESLHPSLVVCPPTLTGHWVYEVQKFVPKGFLNPLHYVGLPIDRERLRQRIGKHNLVVASYDIVRKDIQFFCSIRWNYVVLDEGHVIKNGKTKGSKAIKTLTANHRLILSGTPIQNNVLELWSLFDFLMPGFLGTEKQFSNKFSRPILASRDPKSSAKDQEAGALAMESLHRQVLPFLLRRVKEDVLTDLPPKITQDLLCELSQLQEKLYEDFSKTHLNSDIKGCLEKMDRQQTISKQNTHVFQALRYLQNVCNHPKLVLNQHHPQYDAIQSDLVKRNSSLDDIEHSAKLPALKQLLIDCGIGNDIDSLSVNQHRALIFCQLKAMLDIVEYDLLKKHLPSVSYLRLDGSVPPSSRHNIVTKFNNDPSIEVLLLTTQVGGLGLNLTGADTVIFVEHDWNPMKDLQAMDRAHRIGQKKVVNVYRLITRKSLEEKIMGLQRFKIQTANTIVSDENASLDTMGTENLFDLFNLNDMSSVSPQRSNDRQTTDNQASTMRQVLDNLPELWEDKQYEEEYDMTQFLQSLK